MKRSIAAYVIAVFAGVLLAFTGATVASADPLVVDQLDDPEGGFCNPGGGCSLRQAIAAAPSGATITFAPSVKGTIRLNGYELAVGKDVEIKGPGRADLRISADYRSRVLRVMSADGRPTELRLSGLALENGTVPDDVEGERGGGIIAVDEGTTARITDVEIVRGKAADGGGVLNRGTAVLTNVLITFAEGKAGGGGIANVGDMTLNNVTIRFSLAILGAGIFNMGTLRGENVTLHQNNSYRHGAGLFIFRGTASLNNATITNNAAQGVGGGIAFQPGDGTLALTNSIVATQEGGENCDTQFGTVAGSNNLQDGGTSCGSSFAVGDPKLAPLADNGGGTLTRALLPGSAAINAGENDLCAVTDQRGVARPRTPADRCDIGAYEATGIAGAPPPAANPVPQPPPPPPSQPAPTGPTGTVFTVSTTVDAPSADANSATCRSTAPGNPCTLRAAVQAANRAGTATIVLAASENYRLTLTGSDDAGLAGDLDVTGEITIMPSASGPAAIVQTAPQRVFEVQAGGKLNLTNLTVAGGNTALGGGILVNPEGQAILTGVTLTQNNASDKGGGIFANGVVRAFNTTISGNSATDAGGGVYVGPAGDFRVANVTITNNRAGGGGGISTEGDGQLVILENTIVANQAAGGNCNGPIDNRFSRSNLQNGTAGTQPQCGPSFTVGDPKLSSLAFHGGVTMTHDLGPGSAAIGKAAPGSCRPTDQRGVARFADGKNTCDIGAVEAK
ncbi:MAG: right-handed parallel beta-helix repeat-containing protein [Chloroflexota bacterium]